MSVNAESGLDRPLKFPSHRSEGKDWRGYVAPGIISECKHLFTNFFLFYFIFFSLSEGKRRNVIEHGCGESEGRVLPQPCHPMQGTRRLSNLTLCLLRQEEDTVLSNVCINWTHINRESYITRSSPIYSLRKLAQQGRYSQENIT